MRSYMVIVFPVSFLFACAHSNATPPPRAPNYCGTLACLDISPSFGDASVTVVTPIPSEKAGAKIAVRTGSDEAEIFVRPTSKERCFQSPELIVTGDAHLSEGRSWVSGPDNRSCMEILVEYKRAPESTALPQSGLITALWVVDQTPTTFWESGYSLRIGNELVIKYKLGQPN